MPGSVEIAQSFRRRLLAREARAMKAIVRAYLEAAAGIKSRIDSLASLDNLTANQSLTLERLRSLQVQIQTEIARFSAVATPIVESAQIDAVGLAQTQTIEILTSFSRLATGAIEAAVGGFERGGRLRVLFEGIGKTLADSARKIVVGGIAQGHAPVKVARQLRDSLGIGMNRAMTISRTEILTAFRDSSLASYRANGITRYMWLSTLSPRTCAACLALHGKVFNVDGPMATHPRCRCSLVAVFDSPPRVQSGTSWLASQPADVQESVLGQAGYRAIQSGAVKLSDFVGEGVSAKYGPYRYQASLKEILGRERAVRFYRRVA